MNQRAEPKVMISMRKLFVTAAAAGAAVAAKLGIDKLRRSDHAAAVAGDVRRRGRHLAGQSKGIAYRALRRHPDTNVDDATLADRVRSSIGPLEKRLHIPRVHVTVENGTVILHGEVPNKQAETDIVNAVAGIAGVKDVRSHLTASGT